VSSKYQIGAIQRDGQWIAFARRADTSDRFGIECAGATEAEATARLGRWLDWQGEHEAVLAELQQAEQSYHRAIAGSAFASPTEGPLAIEMQKEALDRVEGARVRLDEVRGRKEPI
jgi:hypothetical protein